MADLKPGRVASALACASVALVAACSGGGQRQANQDVVDPNDRFGSVNVVGDMQADNAAKSVPTPIPTPEVIEAPPPPLATCAMPPPLVSVQADRIATRAYTIDHEKQREWASDIRRDFTDSGWREFRQLMDSEETLRTLRRGKINLSASVDGVSRYVDSDVTGSNCIHKLTVPLRLKYVQAAAPDVEARQVGSEQVFKLSLIEVEGREGEGRKLLVQQLLPIREGVIADPFADLPADASLDLGAE